MSNDNNKYDSILNPQIFKDLGINRDEESKKIDDNIKKEKDNKN